MRNLYTSPRLENIDMVVELLRQHGIAAQVRNTNRWRGRNHARFSYLRDRDQEQWPQVWVIKAEDQPTARALLREAGIEPAVRFGAMLAAERSHEANPEAKRRSTAARIRVALLVILILVIMLRFLRG